MIVKRKNKYLLLSHTGKVLGLFASKAEAEKRERQIQFFKHKAKRKR